MSVDDATSEIPVLPLRPPVPAARPAVRDQLVQLLRSWWWLAIILLLEVFVLGPMLGQQLVEWSRR